MRFRRPPTRSFKLSEKFIKIKLIILLILFWVLWIVMTEKTAGDIITGNYEDNFVMATNSSLTGKFGPLDKYLPVGNGECVAFVQAHGYSSFHGNARDWLKYKNANTPTVGAVVVLNEGKVGHLALVLSLAGDKIWIVEQNYTGKYQISYRTLDIHSPSILGYVLN